MTGHMSTAEKERRDFFRISDRAGLEVELFTGPVDPGMANPFTDTSAAPLHAELQRVDRDIRSQLNGLTEQDRAIGTILKSLNAKVDTLARIMALDQNPLQPAQWKPINLSEGGVGFASDDERLEEGSLVAVRLTLPPEFIRPWGIVEVVSRSQTADGEYWVHTEFRHLHDADRRQIARHVMQWQIRQRNQRETASTDRPATD